MVIGLTPIFLFWRGNAPKNQFSPKRILWDNIRIFADFQLVSKKFNIDNW